MAENNVNIAELMATGNTPENPPEALQMGDQMFLNLVRERNKEKYNSPEIVQPTDNLTNATVGDDDMVLQRPSLLDSKFDVPGIPQVEIQDDNLPEEDAVELNTEEAPVEDPLVEKRKSKETNMKNLRNALKASRDRVAELEAQADVHTKELEKLAELETLKAEIKEKDERLEQLKSYEDLVSLYGTEGFKEKFYDSVTEIRNQAINLAADYGVSEEVLDTAFNITNQRELNEYLSNWFDTFAVQDIRNYIRDAQKIVADREHAESEPAKARELLLTNVAKRKEAERVQARENLKNVGSTAWTEMVSLYGNKDSGVSLLQEKHGNSSHNAVREGILQGASNEYGKMLAILADNGLKELPASAAKALAARFQLGESAAYALVQAENLKREVGELKEELRKFNEYQRPLSNGKTATVSLEKDDSNLKGKDLYRRIYEQAEAKFQSMA